MQTGQILYSSWGYDQTNIDFYEVIKVAGKFAHLQQLEQEITESRPGSMVGHTVPIKGKRKVLYPGAEPVPVPPFKRMVFSRPGFGEYVKIKDYASAQVWDGKPKGCSWYA